jgi:hypothetical protein
MKKSLLKLSCIILLLFSASIIYCNQVYLTLIKEVSLGSEPTDIILNEGIAYVTTGGSVYSYSTADPYKIEETIYQSLSGTSSITFTGRIAYTLGSDNQIHLFDFTQDPPVKKNTIRTNGTIKKIVIDNGYLYVINQDAGLQVYDVNVADFPIFKNTQILPATVNGLFIKDRKAYITGLAANLSIIDAADISKLPIIGTYTNGVKFYEPYVDGNFAYIPQGNTGVQVLNISKLPFPEWVANIPGRKSANQVVSSNFYVWVADDKSIEGFFNKETNAFFFAGNYKNNSVIKRIALIEGKYIYMVTADKKLKVLKIDYKY